MMEQGRGMQRACPLQFLACCSHRQCSLPSPRSTESPKGAHTHGSSVTFKVRCICSWVSGALVAPRGACFLLKPEWQNAERRHRCSKKHDWQTTPSYPFWLVGLSPIDQSFTLKTMKEGKGESGGCRVPSPFSSLLSKPKTECTGGTGAN